MPSQQKVKQKAQRSSEKTRETLNRLGLAIPDGIQALFWLIGVAVFIVLTVRSSVPLLTSYMSEDENVAIQTRLVMNERFPPPQFIVQIPHDIAIRNGTALGRISEHLRQGTEAHCVECQRLAEVSWDVWRGMNISTTFDFDELDEILAGAFLRKLFLKNESDFDALDESNYEWNAPIIDAVIEFFLWRYGLDTSFVFDAEYDSVSYTRFDYSNRTSIDLMYHRAILKALRQRISVSFTCAEKEESDGSAPPGEDLITDNNDISIIVDPMWVWFTLPRITDRKCAFSRALSPQQSDTWKLEEPTVSLYVDPLFPHFSHNSDTNYFGWYKIASAKLTDRKWPRIEVQYSVSVQTLDDRPDDAKRCYDEVSPKVCLWKCVQQLVVERCNCVPFSIHKELQFYTNESVLFVDSPYCTTMDYEDCNETTSDARQQCFKHCSNPCEYTNYNFVVSKDEISQDNSQGGFLIVMSPLSSGPVIQFSNVTKSSGDDILSQVGGVIGLYLGVTGLSLLTFMINLIDFSRQYYRGRKDRGKRKTWALSLFRMAAMNRLITQSSGNDQDDEDDKKEKQSSVPDNHDSDFSDLRLEVETLKEQIVLQKVETERMKSEMEKTKYEMELMKEEMATLLNSNSEKASLDSTLVHKQQCGQ